MSFHLLIFQEVFLLRVFPPENCLFPFTRTPHAPGFLTLKYSTIFQSVCIFRAVLTVNSNCLLYAALAVWSYNVS